ncbi:hypothetical protein LCGC14_1399870, partial [marine sediment metagenome]
MKIRSLTVSPLCCEKGKNTIIGARGVSERGRERGVDDNGITWEISPLGKIRPW